MSKEMGVIVLGVWVIILPYLGIYRSWLIVLMILTGVALMVLGFLQRGEHMSKEQHHNPKAPRRARKPHINFEESAPAATQNFATPEQTNINSSS